MSGGGVDEILSFKKNPEEDFYALLNCSEDSSVSRIILLSLQSLEHFQFNCKFFHRRSESYNIESLDFSFDYVW